MPQPPISETAQELLALELAGGASVAEAAVAAGVSKKTAERHLEKFEFRLQVAKAREAVIARTMSKIVRVANKAVDKLEKLMDCPDEKIQLSAAKAAIAYFASMRPNVANPEEQGEDRRLYPQTRAIELEATPTEVLEAEWQEEKEQGSPIES